MGECKSIFASKTLWGAVIMLVASVLKAFGIEIADAEVTNVSTNVAELVGFIMVVWGRFSARKDLNVTGKPLVLLLAVCVCAFSACALKDKPAYEQAMALSDASLSSYEALYGEYLKLYADLPEQRAMMGDKIAPAMDITKVAVLALADSTTVWVRVKEKPEDWDALYDRANKLIADVTILISKIKGGK